VQKDEECREIDDAKTAVTLISLENHVFLQAAAELYERGS